MQIRIIAVSLLVGLVSFVSVCDAQEFKIQLDRPAKVGDTLDLTILGAGRWKTVVTISGKDPQSKEEAFGISLTGRIEALAVDDKGNPTKISVTVKKCTKLTGAAEKDLLADGDILIAEMKDGKTEFSLKDAGGVSPEVEKALELVIDLHDPRLSGDDAMLGTTEPKKVGESWPINSEVAAKNFQILGLPAKAADLDGKTTLTEDKKVDGVDSIVIKSEFAVHKLAGDLPEGASLREGQIEGSYTGTLPVDASLQATHELSSSKITTVVSNKDPDGIETKVESTVERSSEATFKQGK